MPTEAASIRAVYALADDIDRTEGLLAYKRYHSLLKLLAEHYGVTMEQMTAAFVATSPNNDYLKNLRSAVTLVDGHRRGVPLEQLTVSTYRRCAARAWRVLQGENFLDFTKGLKTRSFYLNILNPEDPDPITIDGHMLGIWAGQYVSMQQATRFRFRYEDVASGARAVAAELGILPNQLQAVCWFTWKRLHTAVRGDGQLRLLDQQDHWRLCLLPADIAPYPDRTRYLPVQQALDFQTQRLWT